MSEEEVMPESPLELRQEPFGPKPPFLVSVAIVALIVVVVATLLRARKPPTDPSLVLWDNRPYLHVKDASGCFQMMLGFKTGGEVVWDLKPEVCASTTSVLAPAHP